MTRKAAVRPARAAPPAVREPSLRFRYSSELHRRALAVLDALEADADPTRHRQALSELVVELTDAGLDYYFLRPLELADSGFVVRQSANLGMMGAKNFMSPVLRSVIGRMEAFQLKIVAGFIRGLMD
jgi:hypothetical protein